MDITEIRIFPKEGQDKKLKAYATVTFDNVFVVRNIKVIQGSNALFIAMPSRKMKFACSQCRFKNEVGSKYCSQCGKVLNSNDFEETGDAKSEHRDIAHPITKEFRNYIQSKILDEFKKEVTGPIRSSTPSDGKFGAPNE